MVNKFPKNILELIDLQHFRDRPGLYLGAKDINILKAFVNGYLYSEECSGKNERTEEYFAEFRDWLTIKIDQPQTTAGWNHMILEMAYNDGNKAVDKFFQLFDEFREMSAKDTTFNSNDITKS